ncbi:MAG: metallophosphoesterase family protein [Acidobacteria bacterium]|nr:metallophosphoesterase family protein [Acidobacteriota bacterium]MBI3655004.1 metallophosphoesterase family protein [Acidobacteriota bacterium]
MRYLIISDLHSNLESLDAALDYQEYDQVLILGDLVGYGANPNEVIDRVRQLPVQAMVRGNHDKVVAGLEDGEFFVGYALEAALWSRRHLTAENLAFLRRLPQGPVTVDSLITLAHGAPLGEDEYIIYEEDARPQFSAFNTPICFFGHSHLPIIFNLGPSQTVLYGIPKHNDRYTLDLTGAQQYLINPGSTGQPRDGDARGSFAVLDTEQKCIEFMRYEYAKEATQRKILEARLPPFLANRLSKGR